MAENLPSSVLAQLFSTYFIIPEEKKGAVPPVATNEEVMPEEKTLLENNQSAGNWFLGSNRRNITIVIADEQNFFIDDKQLQFLTSILSACRLGVDDIAVVNIARGSKPFTDIATELQPRQMILFGIKPALAELPFTIPEYQLQHYGGCTYLFAPELNNLLAVTAAAKEKKTKLWQSLKKMFGV